MGNEDRISHLPTDLLISIISRLTFVEATTTSILSTRWRHLHRYVTRFSLPIYLPRVYTDDWYYAFTVTRVLRLHSGMEGMRIFQNKGFLILFYYYFPSTIY